MELNNYIAVCSKHLAMSLLVTGYGSYDLTVPRDTYLSCLHCDKPAKFAYRRKQTIAVVMEGQG